MHVEPQPGTGSFGPLREELRRSGVWLFRWRSYLPLLPLSLVLLVLLTAPDEPGGGGAPQRAWELACFVLSLAGLAVRVLTVGFVPGKTSGRNVDAQVAATLNTTGMYSVVRHPLYLGNFLMWLGAALLPQSWWLALIVTLAFWLYYERIMFAEEEFLLDSFGGAYLRWARETPAFLPRFSGWRPPALPFCVRTVLRREFSGLFGITATFTALAVVADYAALSRWRLDPLWGAIFAAGLVVYVLLLVLKKMHRLDVPGR